MTWLTALLDYWWLWVLIVCWLAALVIIGAGQQAARADDAEEDGRQ